MSRIRILRLVSTASVALVAAPAFAGCSAKPSTVSAPGQHAGASASAAPASQPAAGPSPSPSASPSATPRPGTAPAAGPLKRGSSGPAVMHLQQQLTALGYWLGTPDGSFGGSTQQAVYALQKAAHLSPTGRVTAATQAALDRGTRPAARSTSGHVIEVNLVRGLLLFVTDGHVEHALNTSTGGGYVYYDEGVRSVAITPKGHFRTYRVIDGPRRSSLGLLIRPRYFTGGFAIHGDGDVPPRPVSHGCVRVTNAAIDWIWSANLDPIGTPVWIY